MDPARVLAVGDSLRTDVAGANAAGIDSLLVTGGIHREELGTRWGAAPDSGAVARLLETATQRPTGIIPALVW
uniref:HAD hydrolase-like protein n=1 Tax=Aerophototrophica crusticola TaxID=1709002 RepID=UPI00384E2813